MKKVLFIMLSVALLGAGCNAKTPENNQTEFSCISSTGEIERSPEKCIRFPKQSGWIYLNDKPYPAKPIKKDYTWKVSKDSEFLCVHPEYENYFASSLSWTCELTASTDTVFLIDLANSLIKQGEEKLEKAKSNRLMEETLNKTIQEAIYAR